MEFLTKKHNGQNNKNQALKVYQGQCRKSEEQKEGIRIVHRDLVEKNFMTRLEDMNEEAKDYIKNAGFQHYNPWRIVMKEDSISTPVRMVVDPTMTGFNLLLAKGENRLGYIFDIIVRNRCRQHAWSSDISKLYNQLHLDVSALPYSLFLFHNSLDPGIEPEVCVMTRAWYGISSTGGQAGAAILKLVDFAREEDTEAVETLENDRFVDDLLGGEETIEGINKQVDGIVRMLSRGGFNLKFVVNSSVKPCEKASSDGETVKMLGYKWTTEPDLLSPGLGELNLNKKIRGSRKPNVLPINSREDAETLLRSVKLTRRTILSKVAELYDPCGVWEPIKLQMKLAMLPLKGLDWDEEIPSAEQEKWVNIIATFVELNEIQMPRCCIPPDDESESKIRLICLADAGEFAGGAVVHA